ncbi:MAG: tetratricopeptide repeat protein [Armatimonadota bacterium]|nr:MAG: tetratricopeptide repeat protein [Armatimonadota bacterium]
MVQFEEAVLLGKWIIASFIGGGLILRSIYAILEREVETWQGILGISTGFALAAVAISLAASPWYYPVLLLIVMVGVVAHMLTVIDNRIRARRMLEEDEARCHEAIEFDDKNAAAHAFLAAVYCKQGRFAEAVSEYERAVELDPHDIETESRLTRLIAEIGERQELPVCPQCESPLDASGATCPECGWSRSTLKGLRDVYASGAVKQGLIYGVIVSTAIGVLSAILGVSMPFTFLVLFIGWLAVLVLFFRWIFRQDL